MNDFQPETEEEPKIVPDTENPSHAHVSIDMEEKLKIQNLALTKLIHHLEKSTENSENSIEP